MPIKSMVMFDDYSTPSKVFAMLQGYGGGGKTYTAMQIAAELAQGAPIAVIDSEHKARQYKRFFPNIQPILLEEYSSASFNEAIDMALTINPAVIIVDSYTHAWNGKGGVLSEVAKKEAQAGRANKVNFYQEPKERNVAVLERLQKLPQHVLVTIRARDKVKIDKDADGKTIITTLTGQPVQDKEIKFPFDFVFRTEDAGKVIVCTKTHASDIFPLRMKFEYGKHIESKQTIAQLFLQWIEITNNG